MMQATSRETPYGRYVTSDGWFVLNLTEALAVRNEEKGGAVYPLEARAAPFGDFGVNVRVLRPGQPSALYHAESGQEGFLVLAGECTLVVEEQERTLRRWDYFHCPPGTRHVFVGAGDGPCAILMVGARNETGDVIYERDPVAVKHGAASPVETTDAAVAYRGRPELEPVPFDPSWLR